MNKSQALHNFWSSFGLKAYEQNSIPDDAVLPYITYETASDSLGNVLPLTASLWYRSNSWTAISQKAEEIAKYLEEVYPISQAIDGGRMYIARGTPFAQRMSDTDTTIKRIVLNIAVEFFTAY